MGLPEVTGIATAFTKHVDIHARVLNPLIKDQVLMTDALGMIQELPQENTDEYLLTELEHAKYISSHLGSTDITRNGISFGVETKNDDNLLVRLYLPTGIESESVKDKVSHSFKSGLTIFSQFAKGILFNDSSIYDKPDRDTYYFASAEILIRTMAHLATVDTPFAQPLPTVLIDNQGQSVGFTLEFNRLPVQAKDAKTEVVDAFFDIEYTYGLAQSAGNEALGFYEMLKMINCLPYAESEKDLKNMLILDDSGKFITFNRIGYVTKEIG